MNKKRVDGWILTAKEAIELTGIASKDGKVNKTFRAQISSFGASLVMGSFKSAVAFFTEQGGAAVERQKLLVAMYYVIFGKIEKPKNIFDFVCNNDSKDLKERFIDASIAIKLALNFFDLEKTQGE